MMARKGFTLVELMVVILIVAILAAVAIPIMRGRIDAAKWSEGKAMMGTIATAIRAYVAEKNIDLVAATQETVTSLHLGFGLNDLVGTYFNDENLFTWTINYNRTTNALDFIIHATKGPTISTPLGWTLNESGLWTEDTTGP